MSRKFYEASSQFSQWTKTEDAMLKKMILDGKNSAQIAEALGRTRSSIFARKSKLGVKAKMAPARGSEMPYVAFEKKRKTEAEALIKASVETKSESLPTVTESPMKTVQASQTIGSQIDTLLSSVKELGLKLKIEISTDDGI